MFSLDAIKNDKVLFEKAVSQVTPEILGSVIDHTALNPTATCADIHKLCREANEIGSFICINGSRVRDAKMYIDNERLINIRGVAAVVGFPFGAEHTTEKEMGALAALVTEKADEVDMVLNIGKWLDKEHEYVYKDIQTVAKMVRRAQNMYGKTKILKVIQENCSLNDEQKSLATMFICEISAEIGIRVFAKTSTGFGTPKNDKTPKGATLEDVCMMNNMAAYYRKDGARIGIKAAGGVGDAETAVKMMIAGGCFDDNAVLLQNLPDIFRIGASAGVKIVNDFKERFR